MAEARALNEEALALARESGERALEAEVLIALARASLAFREPDPARCYADRALELAWSAPYVTLVLGAILVRAELLLETDAARAAELGFFVAAHPAATSLEQAGAEALMGRLGGVLSADEWGRARARGQGASLPEVVAVLTRPDDRPATRGGLPGTLAPRAERTTGR